MATNSESGGLLGPLEAEVMGVLWSARQPLSVRAVLEKLNHGRRPPLAYTTVMTVMSRLAEKDVLRRAKDGRGYVYEAAVSRDQHLAGIVRAALGAADDPESVLRLAAPVPPAR